MQLNEVLRQIGGIGAMARELGVSETQAASGAEALLPAILGGFKWQARAHPTGIDGPGAGLQQLGGGDLSEEVLAPQPTDLGWGNDVLGQIFGTPDVSRKGAQHAASHSRLHASAHRHLLRRAYAFQARHPGSNSVRGGSPLHSFHAYCRGKRPCRIFDERSARRLSSKPWT